MGLAASGGRGAIKRQKFPRNERNKWRLSPPDSECLMEDAAEYCDTKNKKGQEEKIQRGRERGRK